MILNRVVVRNWRGLNATELPEFSPAITLITGNNEAGKTRLAEAMWFALFESSKGSAQHKKELATWGSSEPPEVDLTFSRGGSTYEVRKQFLSSKVQTTLAGAGRTLQGEEAELALAELLQVQAPKSRGAAPEALHWWPFLWVRQFEAGNPPQDSLNDSARNSLLDTLADQVGEIAAGPGGHALLERAQELCRRYWTPSGQPSTHAKAVAIAHEKAQEVLEAVQAEHAAVEADTARLAEVEGAVSVLAAQVATTAEDLRLARERAQQARVLHGQVNQQETEAKLAHSRLEHLGKETETRAEREASLREAERELAETRHKLARHGEDQASLNEQVDQGTRALDAALDIQKGANEQLRRAGAQTRRASLLPELRQLESTLERARGCSAEIAEVTKQYGAISLTGDGLQELEDTHQALTATRAQLQGASTRVEVEALAPLSILDGPTLAAGETYSVSCTAPGEIRLQDRAVVRIYPGGDTLSGLQAQLAELEQDWANLSARFRVESLEEARALWVRRGDLVRDGKDLKGRLALLCPEGVEAMEQRIQQLSGALEELGDEDPEAPPEEDARRAVERANEAVASARVRVTAVQSAAADRATAGATLAERVRGQERNAGNLADLLAKMGPAEELGRKVAAATEAYQEALATLNGLRNQYRECGGEHAAVDAERLEKSHTSQDEERKRLETEQLELATRLDLTAGNDIHGRLQEAQAVERAARRKLERTVRWAAAHKHLVEVLERARQASQRRLLAPAIEGIRPYLHHIFPGAEIALGESMQVEGLQSGNRLETIDALSGGTREQVGAMVRLGLGGLFARDEPLPLVFDDAFTNSDSGRIAQVQRILYQAAKTNLQLIVLTCHPERFAGLGEEARISLPGPVVR